MKKLYIHIGAHKTGTTLLQNNLNLNSALLLANGVRYVPEFFDIFLRMKDAYPLPPEGMDYIKGVTDSLQEVPEDMILISFEGLSGRLQSFYDNTQHIVNMLEYATSNFDVHIIAVTRRQDTFIESIYNQSVKWGNWYPFEPFLEKLVPPDFIKWTDWLARYREKFGRENITVIPYEKIFLGNEEYIQSFVDIFCKDIKVVFDSSVFQNPGYSEAAIKIGIACNRFLEYQDKVKLHAFLEKEMQKKPGEISTLFDQQAREEILERHKEDNIALFSEYMSQYESGYYLGETDRLEIKATL